MKWTRAASVSSGAGGKRSGIRFYNEITDAADQVDPVTQDMVVDILRDEQAHLRLFEGFLREYQAEGRA